MSPQKGEARAVAGRTLRLRSVSGDVEARDIASSEEARLETVSGALTLAVRGPVTQGGITLASVSGDAELRLPERVDATLSLTTQSGEINGLWRSPEGQRHLNASGMNAFTETVGSGAGAGITITTVSGDIIVSQEGV